MKIEIPHQQPLFFAKLLLLCCLLVSSGVKLTTRPMNIQSFHSVKQPIIQKSVNLQYNTLVCLADGTNHSSTKCLMFQEYFFFIKSQNIILKKNFTFFYKIMKMKIQSFECPKSLRRYGKNTWNVRCLVNKSFVPSAQRTSVLCCRLLDFWILRHETSFYESSKLIIYP